MKSIPVAEATQRIGELVEVLVAGGIVCIPLDGAYRLITDALSESALQKVGQSKRRTHDRPSLVLVADRTGARRVVHGMAWPMTKTLTERFWPGALTLALPASTDLPPKLRKTLSRATSAIGVRATADPLASALVQACDRPLFATSANLEKKPGSSSAAVVKQRFLHTVDIWVDAGEIVRSAASTIVALSETGYEITREGAIARTDIEQSLAG